MAQDFFISQFTDDWFLEEGTTIRMCETYEELTRQRLAINLRMYLGEWFADVNYGVPYFESVFGKTTVSEADAIFRRTILNTEGVIAITKFSSELDKLTRKYSLVFSVDTEKGEIKDIEVQV